MKSSTLFNFDGYVNGNFKEDLGSNRKEAIQKLIDTMEKHSLLELSDQLCQKLINDLAEILSKDPNYDVSSTAAHALSKLASDVPEAFQFKASIVILCCFIRMKNSEPKDAYEDCLDSIYSTIDFSNVLKSINRGLLLMSSASKVQTCEFFTKILLKVDSMEAKEVVSELEEIIDQLCELISIENASFQESAIRSLAGIMRALTKEITLPLLTSIATDKSKMEKIEEHYEKFILKYPLVDSSKKEVANDLPKTIPIQTSSIVKVEKVNVVDRPKPTPVQKPSISKVEKVKVERVNAVDRPKPAPVQKPAIVKVEKVNSNDRPKPAPVQKSSIVKPTTSLKKPMNVQLNSKASSPEVINDLPTKFDESQIISGRPSLRPPTAVKRPMSKNSVFSHSSPVISRLKKK